MTLLHPGDVFPELTVQLTDGRSLVVPEEFSGGFGVILFFRRAWCPYCNTQLRAFQRKSAALAEVGARIVALSTDTEQDTAGLIEKQELTFPVGYGADARHLAQLTGAFVNDDPLYVQSTGFVFDPDGRVIVSVDSSGAIGSLVPHDVVGLIRHLRANTGDGTNDRQARHRR